MNPEKWQEIKVIFNQAVEIPVIERSGFLSEACGDDAEMRAELERMLVFADDEENDTLEDNAFQFLADDDEALPEKIGHYKIISEIGRGGMGVVYEAVRETKDFKQRVALKVIKRGMDTDAILSRFRHEQQILASLVHPFIARFLDGGMTEDGLPFYAMEFVEGEDIDKYCRDNDLSIEDHLKLFRQVCAAVQYAHQNFIAHRDLKPNNILVTRDGTPKLLDFGIAKVLSEAADDKTGTATQLGMMTPAYASPEQVRGEKVGVQSDVYTLGVILYELLTEQKPYKINAGRVDEAIRAICETEPVRPSSVVNSGVRGQGSGIRGKTKDQRPKTKNQRPETNPKSKIQNPKSLRGDLDNIILKALKKEPARRYASVEKFSDDIRLHLEGLPVSARPDTFFYRTSKFIKRNKVSVIAASLVFLALVTGVFGTAYQARVAQGERARAEKRFEQVRKIANSVVFKYHDAIADLPGSTAAREMLIKDAVEYLNNLAEDAGDNPTLQQELAQAYLKIGNVQGSAYVANLGDSESALTSYNKSIAIFEDLLKKTPQNVEYLKNYQDVLDQKTLLLTRLNRWQEAEGAGSQTLEVNRRLVELVPDDINLQVRHARSMASMGDAVSISSGYQTGIEWYRKSLELSEKLYADNPQDEAIRRNLTVALQRLGTKSEYYAEILKEKGSPRAEIEALYAEAEKVHRRSLETAESLRRDFPEKEMYKRYVDALQINWATAMARIGKGEEAVSLILRACESLRETTRKDDKNNEAKRDVAECLQYLAFARDAMNQADKAIEANRESLKILEDITVKDPTNFEFLSQTHLTYNNIGDILLKQGKVDEALNYYRNGADYVEKMSKLNDSSQIALLGSESDRKLGEAYLALTKKNKSADALEKSRTYLNKAKTALLELKQKNELNKNYEHKLDLIEKELRDSGQ